ncbi:hypothetical protein BLOT_003057 [Blomia tropicalis]|nr:hypothetical protein BLOT_003057 [Blomia tropicalis]
MLEHSSQIRSRRANLDRSNLPKHPIPVNDFLDICPGILVTAAIVTIANMNNIVNWVSIFAGLIFNRLYLIRISVVNSCDDCDCLNSSFDLRDVFVVTLFGRLDVDFFLLDETFFAADEPEPDEPALLHETAWLALDGGMPVDADS